MTKIIQFSAENVKRLSAVRIDPTAGVNIIAGKNGAGKSSVLDAIEYAIGGKGACPKKPIRNGQAKASTEIKLDNGLVVKRTFTDKGSYLAVTDAAGMKGGQTMLDGLFGALSFDPVAFERMKPVDQLETLKGVIGLDFAKMDVSRKASYDSRTESNREAKRLEARLGSIPDPGEVPAERVDVSALTAKLQEAEASNRSNDEKRRGLEIVTVKHGDTMREIERLKDRLGDLATLENRQMMDIKEREDEIAKIVDVHTQPIADSIGQADAVNERIRQAAERAQIASDLAAERKSSEEKTAMIESIDADKSRMIAEAAMPIEGLAFDDDGITYNGVPFDQCSQAERLRVSVAMGVATNPELRVMLIREGSLLDDDSMKLVADLAETQDVQLWIERVGTDDECSVIIEDGAVRAEKAEASAK